MLNKQDKMDMKRCSAILIIVAMLLPVLLMTTVALAAYSATITVITNETFTSTDMASMYVLKDIDYLKTNGYITSSGLDTRVKYNGDAIPFLLDEDLIAFANPIDASSTTEFEFTAGNTPLSYFNITIGDGGDITTSDNAGLEIGSETFEIILNGYFDTATPISNTTILSKGTDLEIHVGATDGAIGAMINGTTVMTASDIDSGEHEIKLKGYITEVAANQDFTTYTEVDPQSVLNITTDRATVDTADCSDDAVYLYKDFGEGYFDGDFEAHYIIDIGSSTVEAICYMCGFSTKDGGVKEIKESGTDNAIFLYYNHSSGGDDYYTIVEVYSGIHTWLVPIDYDGEETLWIRLIRDDDEGSYGSVTIRAYQSEANMINDVYRMFNFHGYLHERADYQYSIPLSVGWPTGGGGNEISYWVEMIELDPTPVCRIGLYIDDVLEDSYIPEEGYNITDNSSDWVLNWDTIKYLSSYSYEIDGVDKILYQPDSIIYNDTLPNELDEGTYDGLISWGDMGDFQSITIKTDYNAQAAVTDPSYDPGTSVVEGVPDEIPNMYDEGNTDGLPLAPLINPILDDADMDHEAFWYPIAFIIALIFGYAAYRMTRDILVQSVVSGAVMAFFCGGGVLGTGLLPYWTVLVFGIEAMCYIIIRQKQYA